MKQKISKAIALVIVILYFAFFVYLLQNITDFALILLLAMFLAIPFMVVTHEAGHLIFGLLTGYKFISFRIFSLMLLRENGKFKIRKHKVPGTAGQCLMAPPQKKNGRYPYVLYNLGGILVCAVLSFIPMVISVFFLEYESVAMPLFVFGFVSFAMNLMNAIPTNGKSMMNDATNLRMANRSGAGKDALWNQLEYMHLHSKNIRTADMPKTLFFHPEEKDLNNTLVHWQVLANIERLEDMGDYEKAQAETSYILEKAPFLPQIYRDLFELEAIYISAVLGNDDERIHASFQSFDKRPLVKNTINFARVHWAYLSLCKKDEAAANSARKTYEAKIKKEPYLASADFERRQMAQIDALAER
ncbi:MAG: hypothetical protein IJ489_11625 [Clostridia bacterium]|nr:hypothetical protein [Clostridia bacterium]